MNSKAVTVLVGDCVHNIFDGMVVAAAFKGCGSVGWTVTLAIALHELPSEIGDYFILVYSGLTAGQAAWWNFLSAMSSYLGVILVLTLKDLREESLGFLLIFGGVSKAYLNFLCK